MNESHKEIPGNSGSSRFAIRRRKTVRFKSGGTCSLSKEDGSLPGIEEASLDSSLASIQEDFGVFESGVGSFSEFLEFSTADLPEGRVRTLSTSSDVPKWLQHRRTKRFPKVRKIKKMLRTTSKVAFDIFCRICRLSCILALSIVFVAAFLFFLTW